MLKALVLKELRETGWIALLGLVVHLAVVAGCAGYHPWWIPNYSQKKANEIPLIDSSFVFYFCVVSIAVAVAVGLRQTVSESRGRTWLFLLHRPARLWQVLAAKLAAGMALYLLCGLIPILTFAAWSATPSAQAAPFFWWMTYDAWSALGIISLFYLAAFLTGIRPARWLGTRLLPLVAGGVLVCFVFVGFYAPIAGRVVPSTGVVLFLVVAAYLVGLIHYTAKSRDFS